MTIFMIKHSPDNRAVAGCNAPQGSASQESFSGKGTVSGGQSVDLQSQTYDATYKTVAKNARTHNSFDAGVDQDLPSNSPLTRIRRLSLFWDSTFFMGHISKVSGCHIPLESFFRALSRGVSEN